MTVDFRTNLVLVTGARGWLGQNLVKALARGLADVEAMRVAVSGLTIRALVLPDQQVSPLRQISDRVEVVEGDLRSSADCRRFCRGAEGAVLFHTAGVVHPSKVHCFYDVNVEGTKNLLDAATNSGVRRAVAVSSNSPCGFNPNPDHRFDERSPYRPYMGYGRSKMQMELAVRAAQEAGAIETVILRPPWFYGPCQPSRQTLFFRMIRDGKAPIVGSGENVRSMVYVDNLCQAMILAASAERAKGETYWIADERPYTANEIVGTIERLMQREFGQACAHRRLRLPAVAGTAAWLVDKTLQRVGIYHQRIHVLSEMGRTIACSSDKAREQLGYRPAIGPEEGMRRSLQWLVDVAGAEDFLET